MSLKSCGIYKITNLINGKVYIGQSVDIQKRWKDHLSDAFKEGSKSYNYPLYVDIRQYGKSNFSFDVIEICTPEDLDEKEISNISLYESYPPEHGKGYNQTPGGQGISLKVFPHLDEITRMLRESNMTQKELSQLFNIGEEIIQGINTGRYWKRDNIKYPIRERKTRNGALWGSTKEIKHYCPICEKEIYKDSKCCMSCRSKLYIQEGWEALFAIPVPSKEELLRHFYSLKNCQKVADTYGISTMLLKKWRTILSLPEKVKDIIELYEKDYLGIIIENKPKNIFIWLR